VACWEGVGPWKRGQDVAERVDQRGKVGPTETHMSSSL